MKKITLLAGIVIAAGFSTMASAHDYGGTLGTLSNATDKFYIVCPTGTAKMAYQVRRNTAPTGSAQLNLCGLKSTAACPPANNTVTTGTGTFSPLRTIGSGSGAYFYTLKKNTASGATNSYTVRAHCQDAGGNHLSQPSTVTYLQNQ